MHARDLRLPLSSPGSYRPLIGVGFLAGADGRGKEDVVVPDDGRAPARARACRSSRRRSRSRSTFGQRGIVGDDAGLRAAELATGRSRTRSGQQREAEGDDH